MKSSNNKKVSVITVHLGCKGGETPENNYRYEIFGKENTILFSAGFYWIPFSDNLLDYNKQKL
jgi:hypothetical protein